MRELRFTTEFDEGVDPVMDAFIAHPRLEADSVASCVRRDRFWRIERFTGPSDALDRVQRCRVEEPRQHEGLATIECDGERHQEVLDRAANTLVLYEFTERLHTCDCVLALAARHLDLGHVVQRRCREHRQEWRLLLRSEVNVDVFYDAVDENLVDDATLSVGRLGEVERWSFDSLTTVSLSRTERDTLRAAIEHGYYETPREVTVSELSERLGVPRSTVSYRLRKAEARLARGYVRRSVAGKDGTDRSVEPPDA